MNQNNLCLVGEVVVDVTRRSSKSETKIRLGGITHAARALWALNIPFDIAYFAPAYLDSHIRKYFTSLGCVEINKLGDVTGAPGIFLIEDAKEIGDQGYEFILRDDHRIVIDSAARDVVSKILYDDVFMISGNFDLIDVLSIFNGAIHLDLANNISEITQLAPIKQEIDTLFLSTSSQIFLNQYKNDFSAYVSLFEAYAKKVVLKENRGGSRAVNFSTNQVFAIPSQPRKIVHSVGVGDAYDATCVAYQRKGQSFENSLVLASWIAAEYASTTYPDDFKENVQRVLNSNLTDLKKMPGVLLPWEHRKAVNVYLAGPDFSFIDNSLIDSVENALSYHNFMPLRPVKLNGEMEAEASKERRQHLFNKDMELLSKCQLLIGVLLYNDPGTLIEIGLAAAKGVPTLVFDPFNIAKNCMLTELPTFITNDLEELIAEVFYQSSNLKNHG